MNELSEFRAALREFRFTVIVCAVIIVLTIAGFVAVLLMFLPPLIEAKLIEALNYYNSTIQTP